MTLRRLGLLIRNRDIGGLQILPSVRDFLTPEYDAITEGLRRVLGTNIEGPQQLVCNCQSCRRIRNEALQGLREQLHDFKADMRRQ